MILSIDQGTTGTTVLIFDSSGHIIGRSYNEFTQYYPQPGWVEHDPVELWEVSYLTIEQALHSANIKASELSAIGITNQRETMVVWDRETGEPVYNAIVWQCRRSSSLCDALKAAGNEALIQAKTGLLIDAYFSASKLQWLFNEMPELRQRAIDGELCFGTIDSWLIWKMTAGSAHLTDPTNASRTLLYNITEACWDPELLDLFGIPASILPTVKASAGFFADTNPGEFFGVTVPICGVAGDQQAALFGQRCTQPGDIKNTYGTGCFMLMYAGACSDVEQPQSTSGLLTTIACTSEGLPAYALEGSVFTAGAAVQWLRDQLGLIETAAETQAIAESIPHTSGVYMVPALTGLGAPWWDMAARGAIVGLTPGAGRKEIIRACLEAIAYQSLELALLMSREANADIKQLRVDGGASANDFLMQFQSDILNAEVQRPEQVESTAIGAALLAGIGSGLWSPEKLPTSLTKLDKTFKPLMTVEKRQHFFNGWRNAVAQVQAGNRSDASATVTQKPGL
jgi:glycerol kinase